MNSNSTSEYSEAAPKSSLLFLVLLSLALGYAVVFAASPIAQSHGTLRTQMSISILLMASLGVVFSLFAFSTARRISRLERLAFLFPLYALVQLVPLPVTVLLRALSPERVHLLNALEPVIPIPGWAPLSVAPSATFYHFLILAACAVVFTVSGNLARAFSLRHWIPVVPLILIAASEAVLGLMQVSLNPEAVATGTYAIRNHYAGLLEMVLPFSALLPFAAFASRKPGARGDFTSALLACIGFGASALLAGGIVASLSRMGFFASLASMMFVAVTALSHGRSPGRISLMTIAAVVVALLIVLLVPSARLVDRFGEIEKTKEARTPTRDTLHLIADYPLVGCGLGTYESAFVKYKTSQAALNQDYAHNDYLQYLAELGFPAFALALLALALIFARLFRKLAQCPPGLRYLRLACAGSALAIGIHSWVDFNLYVPANLFTFAWILGIATHAGRLPPGTRREPLFPATVISVPMTSVRSRSSR